MIKLVVFLTAGALAVAGTAAAKPAKPKPWMWPSTRVEQRLYRVTAEKLGLALEQTGFTNVDCSGRGKAVARRYVAFRCKATLETQGVDGRTATLWIRLRPAGSGKMCASEVSLAAIPKTCLAA